MRLAAQPDRWQEVAAALPGKNRLRLEARAVQIDRWQPTELTLEWKLGEKIARRRVAFQLEPKDQVELVLTRVVEGASPVLQRPALDAADVSECRAFPNRVTDFALALKNLSGRPRAVRVQLWAVPSRSERTSEARKGPLDEFRRLRRGFVPLSEAIELKLPANDSAVPIPFPEPKPDKPEPKASAEKPAAKDEKTKPVEEKAAATPDVSGGIACLIEDSAGKNSWTRWIEFVPIQPDEYLEARVGYDHTEGRIDVRLRLVDQRTRAPLVAPETPVQVTWSILDLAAPEASLAPERTLAKLAAPGEETHLFAPVPRDRTLRVLLDVDQWPRALAYDLETNRTAEAQRQGDLRQNPHRRPDTRRMLQESACQRRPAARPVPGRRSPRRLPRPEQCHRSLVGRQTRPARCRRHAPTLPLAASGHLPTGTIGAAGVDAGPHGRPRFPRRAGYPLPHQLAPRSSPSSCSLKSPSSGATAARTAWKSCSTATRRGSHALSRPTRSKRAKNSPCASRSRILSGAVKLEYGFDRDNSGWLDDKEKAPEPVAPRADGLFTFNVPTNDLAAGQKHVLRVRATDRVNLRSRDEGVYVTVAEKAEMAKPKAETGSIDGQVYFKSSGTVVDWYRIQVRLVELGRDANVVDDNGHFVFTAVPLGKYTIEVSGNAQSTLGLKGSTQVTVAPGTVRTTIITNKP